MWDYLVALDPDVALLQEVITVPANVQARFACHQRRAKARLDYTLKISTVLLVKGRLGRVLELRHATSWVQRELRYWEGNLMAVVALPDNGPAINTVSVYSPAFSIDAHVARDGAVDTSGVHLAHNPGIWVADLLRASLEESKPDRSLPWVIGGDFNLSETFDRGRKAPRGNKEYLDRMAGVGLVECLRHHQGELTPTFRSPRGGAVVHQLDHLFVTPVLADRLQRCETCPPDEVFGASLSDHLPLVADFRWPDVE